MPVRIEELVFKTVIKADQKSNQGPSLDKGSANESGLQQLKKDLVQELKNIAAEQLVGNQER